MTAEAIRLVLDTNVWLDWLVFADPEVEPIASMLTRGEAVAFGDDSCEAEFARVLGYPLGRHTLDPDRASGVLARYRAIIARPPPPAVPARPLPVCRDPDDQRFLEVARDCDAHALVTRDRALLELRDHRGGSPPFRILTPREFRAGGIGATSPRGGPARGRS